MTHPATQAAQVRTLRNALQDMRPDDIPAALAKALADRFGVARAEQILADAQRSLLPSSKNT